MKNLKLKVLTSLVAVTPLTFGADKLSTAQVTAVLQKPVIAGASISADWGTMSPGKNLSLRYTTMKNIRTVAYGGRPGRETVGGTQCSPTHTHRADVDFRVKR